MNAFVQLSIDQTSIGRLCMMGYMAVTERDPTAIRDAVSAALADRLTPPPAALATDGRG